MLRVKGTGRLLRPVCPACKSTDTRKSRAKGPWERIQHFLFVRFYRCRRCNTRFSGARIVWDRRHILVLASIFALSIAFAFGAIELTQSPYLSLRAWIRGIIRNFELYTPKEDVRETLLKAKEVSER